jgi:hypothetical protein
MAGYFTTNKTGLVTFYPPGHNLKKQISWTFHVDDLVRSPNTNDMVISRRSPWRIRLNFNNHTVTILMKYKGAINTQGYLLEFYLT